MDQYINRCTVLFKCAFSQTTKSQRSINNELQYNAKQDLILISNNFFDILVI